MQRLMGLSRIWPKLRFCASKSTEKPNSGLAILETQKRTFMSKTSDILEKKLKYQDDIPDDFTLVYRGGMDNYVHSAYIVTTLSLGFTTLSLYNILDHDGPLQFPLKSAWDALIGIENYTQLFIIYASLFAMIITVRNISKRYVLRMYYNEKTETYRAVRVGHIPTAIRPYDFQARTLQRLKSRSLIPWWNLQYKIKGEKFLLFDEGFKTPADFDRMFVD